MRHYVLLVSIAGMCVIVFGCTNAAPKCENTDTVNTVLKIAPELVVKTKIREAESDNSLGAAYLTALSGGNAMSSALLAGMANQGVKVQIGKEMEGAIYELDQITTTDFKKEIGTYYCAANLTVTTKGNNKIKIPLSYKTELTDGGNKFLVTLEVPPSNQWNVYKCKTKENSEKMSPKILNDNEINVNRKAESSRLSNNETNIPDSKLKYDDKLKSFINTFIAVSGAEDLDKIEKCYSEKVKYYGKILTKDEVMRSKRAYFKRWPVLHYKIIDFNVQNTNDDNMKRIICKMDYFAKNDKKEVSGISEAVWDVIITDQSLLIAMEDSKVLERH